ncbi:MAG: biotin--[acetyl-CoA-carboxylase] ligase [Thermoanaerobaculia bacterium]
MIRFFEDPIDVAEFRNLRNFVFAPVLPSTNQAGRGWIDYADREEVAVAPLAICALEQTEGRGRRDRTWRSPRGGLYLTFVWKVPPGSSLSHLPLAAAVWAAEACSRAFGLSVGLKWPNDLLFSGKKLGGILTEARTRGEETHAAVGFGVNVLDNLELTKDAGATAAARESGRPASIGSAFLELCREFDRYLDRPDTGSVVEDWKSRAVHRAGDQIRILLDPENPESCVDGAFDGVTEEGFLRLRTATGEKVVTSGEVRSW